MFRDPGQHAWSYLFFIVEREHDIGRTFPSQNFVRTRLTFDGPTDSEQSSEDPRRASTRPRGHAAANVIVVNSGLASPCSRRSATTRRASA